MAEDEVDAKLFGQDLFGTPIRNTNGPIADKFVFPPFTTLDARAGDWQDRKRAWLSMGIRSEIGRGDNLIASGGGCYTKMKAPDGNFGYGKTLGTIGSQGASLGAGLMARRGPDGELEYVNIHAGRAKAFNTEGTISEATGTSIFDPVLCECLYRWFSGPGDQVIDPFAGGSVRGIVASTLGRKYWGCDLRPEQIAANEEQAREIISKDPVPKWVCGNSMTTLPTAPMADMIFSCPPYFDLEQYSDHGEDLSAMGWSEFCASYERIIYLACERLKPNRFAAFVVAEIRDKSTGFFRDFLGVTTTCFREAGLHYYNEAILLTAVGSAAIRVSRQFDGGRKLCKTHQNILIFVKGDCKLAAEHCIRGS